MQVFTVRAHVVEDGFRVTSPHFPRLSHVAQSLDHCAATKLIAEQVGATVDRAWLQIEVHAKGLALVSTVHPQHLLSLHTITRFGTSRGVAHGSIDDLVAAVLLHEYQYAEAHDRGAPNVRFRLSFPTGWKVDLPTTGTYPLDDILAHDESGKACVEDSSHATVLSWLQQRIPPSPESHALPVPQWNSLQCMITAAGYKPSTRYR